MKKIFFSIFLISLLFLSSCGKTVIPNSAEAETKMKELGYSTELKVYYGDSVENLGITQMTQLDADKDGSFLQVYFFANEEDTTSFYEQRASVLSKDVEVLKKNKYSVYRGSESAVADFLS